MLSLCIHQVLETGLGGRLDATNILQHPALTIITSIGLEHTRILGDTVEKIALEKGGIIKKGRPVLVGPEVPLDVLRQCAEEKGASSFHTCHEVLNDGQNDKLNSDSNNGDGTNGMAVKDYDEENSRMVKAAFSILQDYQQKEQGHKESTLTWKNFYSITLDHIYCGTKVRPPCRFEMVHVTMNSNSGEIIAPTMNRTQSITYIEDIVPESNHNMTGSNTDQTIVTAILDVAHNPPAMVHLASKLQETFPDKPKRFVAGFSSDKDLRQCTQTLLNVCENDVNRIHLIKASHPRAATLQAILEAAPELQKGKYANPNADDMSITAQLKTALKIASKQNEILVICGSVFIMAEAREALGFDEPKDSEYIAEVAGSNLKHGQENFGSTDKKD